MEEMLDGFTNLLAHPARAIAPHVIGAPATSIRVVQHVAPSVDCRRLRLLPAADEQGHAHSANQAESERSDERLARTLSNHFLGALVRFSNRVGALTRRLGDFRGTLRRL